MRVCVCSLGELPQAFTHLLFFSLVISHGVVIAQIFYIVLHLPHSREWHVITITGSLMELLFHVTNTCSVSLSF